MKKDAFNKYRRIFLSNMGAGGMMVFLGAYSGLFDTKAFAQNFATEARAIKSPGQIITKSIPTSGEKIPVIGMGTWITFNVGDDVALRNQRTKILNEFFSRGGQVIDCSPMYGSSADVLGYALNKIGNPSDLFSASKIWTSSTEEGAQQVREQKKKWNSGTFDLMQIHNLRNWEGHLETLQQLKADGEIRYIGITTSHGRRHNELENIMRKHDLDFVQLTYNITDREAERRLLPLAKERGVAVIANRPYKQKALFRAYQNKALPRWANEEAGAQNWAEFFLKFIVSHDAVTCAIPATSNISHMTENMGACYGQLPDAALRQRMVHYLEEL